MKQNVEQVVSAQLTHSNFIICNDDKVPIMKHKSGGEALSYEEVNDYDNVSISLDRDIVVFDFDEENHAEKFLKILSHLGIKTLIIQTERGIHVYFKTDKTFQDKRVTLSVGLKCDIKSGKNNGLVVIKQNGIWRKTYMDEPIAELPKEFFVMHNELITTLSDERNEQLFRYTASLNTSSKYKDIPTTIKRKVLELCNDFAFDEPLDREEFESAIRELKSTKSSRSSFRYNRNAIDLFAVNAINKLNIKSHNNQLYFWYKNKYICDDNILKGMIQSIDAQIVSSELYNVIEYIRNHLVIREIKPLDTYISFINCILDIDTGMTYSHSPEFFITTNFPIVYNSKADDKQVKKFLYDISDENDGIFTLLKQMLGYTLFTDNSLQKAFILLGAGSNGKSLLFNILKKVIGDINCSSVELQDFEKIFDITEALDKIINVGEEITRSSLQNLTNFKKITSGGDVQAQRKFGHPFNVKPRVKLLFACNSLPKTADTSDAFFSRLVIIPFKRTFMRGTPNCDPDLEYKLSTENNLSALFNIILKSYKELKTTMRFISISESEDALLTYKHMLDPILMWFSKLDRVPPFNKAYTLFRQHCEVDGVKDIPDKNTFEARYLELSGDVPGQSTNEK